MRLSLLHRRGATSPIENGEPTQRRKTAKNAKLWYGRLFYRQQISGLCVFALNSLPTRHDLPFTSFDLSLLWGVDLEIDVGGLDQVGFFDMQLRHQCVCHNCSVGRVFVRMEDDFEFNE